MRLFVLLTITLAGCAHTHYYTVDMEGKKELPGMPFLWKDSHGALHDGYVSTCSGFGTASFEIERSETTGIYTKFSNNLDSTAAAQLAGGLIDHAFELGKSAGAAEEKAKTTKEVEQNRAKLREEIERIDIDRDVRRRLLETLK
jgi:hypothetical protein